MKILIDIGHPAHVHYFRNFIKIMEERGHKFLIIARNRGIIKELLDKYNIVFITRGKGSDSKIGKLYYMIKADFLIYKLAKKFKSDLFLSFSSPYAAQVSWLLKKPHISINDTEHTDKIHSTFTYPFSEIILTPKSYYNSIGSKQIRFESVVESLYLDANFFKFSKGIKKELGLNETEEFVIIRFVSWKAHHDYGQSGLDKDTILKLITLLKKEYSVFISSEAELPKEFDEYKIIISPDKMHSVLKEATIFIGESATMASESTILGTQAIYINSLPLMGYLNFEQESGLLKHFKASPGVVDYVSNILKDKNLKSLSKKNRKRCKKTLLTLLYF